MPEIKLIITGPPGAGKTTAIEAISETPPVRTDTRTTDDLSSVKDETTVAMDFGEITLESGEKVFLYGTPGQRRFEFMWKILVEGGLGLIILVDCSRPDPIDDLKMYLENFSDFIERTGVVVGITRTSEPDAPELTEFYECLESNDRVFPILDVDIREREDVALLINALVSTLEFSR
ncbi:MAG: GTP-binding protein [Gammaproteobacteria bacterium]|uniref:ATP/GTP-binding protein n=1 Tax=Marinobacter nitratireducens TaxID=1137280 RepID=A0A072N0Y8_9GAMM|nr:ATP/GTP-binding protein [Marinobacter nitratireducens]KEF31151.1 ATP/GTP-binding protein [Marinobacter nitratireducens]TNE72448.1 MAG: GTP-binding protein [Gammaproteobacteria bacterium]